MDKFESVIGLEVHVQLKTETKIFCGCSAKFGQEQNVSVCPVCLGLPGSLPVLNINVMRLGIIAGLALNCKISNNFKFDRKNYFYPDLPKAYQISQLDRPLASDGYITISAEGKDKRITIVRAHLEEDAGKLLHDEASRVADSCIDYNRTGTPLLEIVSAPDMNSPQEAHEYLSIIKAILEYIEVSDCNMQEGSLRCDANVSVKRQGQAELGTKAEIKNMNSFKAVEKAISYEITRQISLIESGQRVVQETRLWDADAEKTHSMRSKEESHDYRYFPEPDLPHVEVSDSLIEELRKTIPELPKERHKRYVCDFDLSERDASVMVSQKGIADYFEECTGLYKDYKVISNWIMGDLMAAINESHVRIEESKVTPADLIDLINIVEDGTVSLRAAKEVFSDMFKSGQKAAEIVKKKGLAQISDEPELENIAGKVIMDNPGPVSDYKAGNQKSIGFLMGQAMKLSKGKANPKALNKIIQKKLNGV